MAHGFFANIGKVGVASDKTWQKVSKLAQQIVDNQDLTVAYITSSNAYGGDLQPLLDRFGNRGRHHLQYHCKAACVLDGSGVVYQLDRILGRTALDSGASKSMYGLGRIA